MQLNELHLFFVSLSMPRFPPEGSCVDVTYRNKRRSQLSNCGDYSVRAPSPLNIGSADFPGGWRRCQEYSVASLNMKNLMSPTPRN